MRGALPGATLSPPRARAAVGSRSRAGAWSGRTPGGPPSALLLRLLPGSRVGNPAPQSKSQPADAAAGAAERPPGRGRVRPGRARHENSRARLGLRRFCAPRRGRVEEGGRGACREPRRYEEPPRSPSLDGSGGVFSGFSQASLPSTPLSISLVHFIHRSLRSFHSWTE